jgi:DNA-binding HxlR family transcriptional regulator
MDQQDKIITICPVATFLGLISNKWKVEILWYLLQGKQRFGELRRNVKGISQKVLTDNLRSMERDGLLKRTVYAEVPPRVEYELSEVGETLRDVLDTMRVWGMEYLHKQHPGQHFLTCRDSKMLDKRK